MSDSEDADYIMVVEKEYARLRSEKNESLAEARDREAALLARVERLQFALAEINAGCERHHVNGYGSFCRNEDHEIVRKALSEDKHEC